MLMHKLYSLKSTENFLLILMVAIYTEKFEEFKKRYKTIFTTFQNAAHSYSLNNPPDNPTLFSKY